jgi:hypothetical protein
MKSETERRRYPSARNERACHLLCFHAEATGCAGGVQKSMLGFELDQIR